MVLSTYYVSASVVVSLTYHISASVVDEGVVPENDVDGMSAIFFPVEGRVVEEEDAAPVADELVEHQLA